MSATTVLFIGGAGRSGSTLLETLLAQIDGVVPLGELNEVWKAGVIENRLCGCGRRFLECDFWMSVFDAAFGGVDRIDIKDIIEAQDSTCRMRYIPVMAWSRLQSASYREKLSTLRNANKMLLEGVRRVSEARVIVDSSKAPSQAYMLSKLDNISLHILQLVRDSRAVAHSWQRKKTVPDPERGNPEMVRMTSFQSALDWNFRHFFLQLIKNVKSGNIKSYTVMRYEDLTRSPSLALSKLVAGLGLDTDLNTLFESPFVVFRTRVAHTLEGNPSKFKAGNININADDEWKNAMLSVDRTIVSILTAPYLKKFGYFRDPFL